MPLLGRDLLRYYRGYKCTPKADGLLVKLLYRHCNFWLPRRFFWIDRNWAELARYINALAEKRTTDARVFEDAGLAVDHIYEPPPAKTKIVRVSPRRLLAVLRGEDVLEIPSDHRLIVDDSHSRKQTLNNAMGDIISDGEILTAHIEQLKTMLGAGYPVFYFTTEETDRLKGPLKNMEAVHTGFNLPDHTSDEPALAQATPPEPVQETPVRSVDLGTHEERVSLISSNTSQPYFVRRLLRGSHLLWQGTSFHANGPWTEYQRDASRLAALGIEP